MVKEYYSEKISCYERFTSNIKKYYLQCNNFYKKISLHSIFFLISFKKRNYIYKKCCVKPLKIFKQRQTDFLSTSLGCLPWNINPKHPLQNKNMIINSRRTKWPVDGQLGVTYGGTPESVGLQGLVRRPLLHPQGLQAGEGALLHHHLGFTGTERYKSHVTSVRKVRITCYISQKGTNHM